MQNRFRSDTLVIYRDRFLELFGQKRLAARVRIVRTGLGASPDSGARRRAYRELAHLISWGAALAVPLIVVFLLHCVALVPRSTPTPRRPVAWKASEPAPEPLDPDPLPEPEPLVTAALPGHQEAARLMEPSSQAPTPMDIPPAPAQPLLPPVALSKGPINLSLPIGIQGLGRRRAVVQQMPGGPSEDAVLRALRWLKSEQRADGSWTSPAPAMTGLALLCFLGHGEVPGESPEFGDTVRGGVAWLLANQGGDGRFPGSDPHEYSLPIATYALAEAYGMLRRPDLRTACAKSVAVIVKGQNASGGWNYNCRPSDRNDTSYMGWCIQALKAAWMAGIRVPGLQAAMSQAADGLRCNAAANGGFGYTSPGHGGLTGVGVLGLQMLGAGESNAARLGLARLDSITMAWNAPWGARPLYYWYYATQAKFHAGGKAWEHWDPRFADELTRNQTVVAADLNMGYWDSPGAGEEYGRIYSTSMCTLTLEVYYRYLDTYSDLQRVDEGGPEAEPVPITVEFPDRADA